MDFAKTQKACTAQRFDRPTQDGALSVDQPSEASRELYRHAEGRQDELPSRLTIRQRKYADEQ